jgi:hypothetical protein
MNQMRDNLPGADSRDYLLFTQSVGRLLGTPGWNEISALAAADGVNIDEMGYAAIRPWIEGAMGKLLLKGNSLASQWRMSPRAWVDVLMSPHRPEAPKVPAVGGGEVTILEIPAECQSVSMTADQVAHADGKTVKNASDWIRTSGIRYARKGRRYVVDTRFCPNAKRST